MTTTIVSIGDCAAGWSSNRSAPNVRSASRSRSSSEHALTNGASASAPIVVAVVRKKSRRSIARFYRVDVPACEQLQARYDPRAMGDTRVAALLAEVGAPSDVEVEIDGRIRSSGAVPRG